VKSKKSLCGFIMLTKLDTGTLQNHIPLILIVDDDPCSNLILKSLLIQEGFRAVDATDSNGCFRYINEHVPDLILLDVDFPDESGYDICRKIRSSPTVSDVPVLFISGNSDVSSKLLGFEAGGVDYIPKPYHRMEVLARVRTHLRLQQALRSKEELQSIRLNKLKEAQNAILVKPCDEPEARFAVFFKMLQEAGGDFYDVIPVGDYVYDYILADISGHDVGMVLVSSALKMLLRQNCNLVSSPVDVLIEINRVIKSVLNPGQFVAMNIIRLNRKTGRALIVNAGIPAPVIFRASGKEVCPIEIQGDLVGIFPDVSFMSVELEVKTGDRLVIFSDGLPDLFGDEANRWNTKMQKVAGLLSELSEVPLEILPEAVGDRIKSLGSPPDDIVVLVIEV